MVTDVKRVVYYGSNFALAIVHALYLNEGLKPDPNAYLAGDVLGLAA